VAELEYTLTIIGQGGSVHLAVVGVVLLLQAPVRGLDRSVGRATRHLKQCAYTEWEAPWGKPPGGRAWLAVF
jgi:hypothetical protein